jgi:hypothetical protein
MPANRFRDKLITQSHFRNLVKFALDWFWRNYMKVRYFTSVAVASILGFGLVTACAQPETTTPTEPAAEQEQTTEAEPAADTTAPAEDPCAAKDPCAAEDPCAAKDPCAAEDPYAAKEPCAAN